MNVDRSPITNWDTFWSGRNQPTRPSPVVEHIVNLYRGELRGKRLLEVGAGSGRDIVALAALGADATANDRSAEARRAISELARSRGVTVTINADDLRSIELPENNFDLIYSQGVVEHFDAPDPVIAEQRRLVRAGGRVIVDVPQTFNPYTVYKQLLMAAGKWPPGWETQYTPFALRRLGERNGLSFESMYSWGEHGTLSKLVLDPLDRWPWTATCIGAIFTKSISA